MKKARKGLKSFPNERLIMTLKCKEKRQSRYWIFNFQNLGSSKKEIKVPERRFKPLLFFLNERLVYILEYHRSHQKSRHIF